MVGVTASEFRVGNVMYNAVRADAPAQELTRTPFVNTYEDLAVTIETIPDIEINYKPPPATNTTIRTTCKPIRALPITHKIRPPPNP